MRIEVDSSTGIITINGIDLQIDSLDILTKAKPQYIYQFRRDGENVMVRMWQTRDIVFPKGLEPMDYGE